MFFTFVFSFCFLPVGDHIPAPCPRLLCTSTSKYICDSYDVFLRCGQSEQGTLRQFCNRAATFCVIALVPHLAAAAVALTAVSMADSSSDRSRACVCASLLRGIMP